MIPANESTRISGVAIIGLALRDYEPFIPSLVKRDDGSWLASCKPPWIDTWIYGVAGSSEMALEMLGLGVMRFS